MLTFRSQLFTVFLTLLLCQASTTLWSQRVALGPIKTDLFPSVRADINVYDAANDEVKNLSMQDLTLTENGNYITNFSILTKDTTRIQPCATMFVVDVSGSTATIADTITHETRLQWMQSAIDSVFRHFPDDDKVYYGAISFSSLAKLRCSLTHNISRVIDSVYAMKSGGGTDYNNPFLDSTNGAIAALAEMPPTALRRIVFITDGGPDHATQTDSIIRACNRQAIQCYVISIASNTWPDLVTITSNTGGQQFVVHSKDDIINVLRLLYTKMYFRTMSTLVWKSLYTCSSAETTRNISLSYSKKFFAETSQIYTVPASSVIEVISSPPRLDFGLVEALATRQKTLNFTVRNTQATIQSIRINPPVYYTIASLGGKSLPFALNPKEPLKITVKFNQGALNVPRDASLIIVTESCSYEIPLRGGQQYFSIDSPSGGEELSACDSIRIRWSGVDSSQAVNLYYTLSQDTLNPDWILLDKNQTHGLYSWYHRDSVQNIRLRATAQRAAGYDWTRNIGGLQPDTACSIDWCGVDSSVCVAGTFAQNITSELGTVLDFGAKDGFVCKLRSDNKLLWLSTFGGNADDRATAVCNDSLGRVYACGWFHSPQLQVESQLLQRGPLDSINALLICYDARFGTVRWAQCAGGTSTGVGFAYADSIAYENGLIHVYGYYRNRLRFTGYQLGPGYLELNHSTQAQTLFRFSATFGTDGHIQSLQEGFAAHRYTSNYVIDPDSNVYEVGAFSGIQNNGSAALNLTSHGDMDVFIRKTHPARPISTQSRSFHIKGNPVVLINKSMHISGAVIGDTARQFFTRLLVNLGQQDVLIRSWKIVGADSSAFSIDNFAANTVVPLDQELSLVLAFCAKHLGTSKAMLVLEHDCYSDSLELSAEAGPASGVQSVADAHLTVYPQPCSDELFIQLQHPTSFSSLYLVNQLGQEFAIKVLSQNDGSTLRCSVRDIPIGVYALRVGRFDSSPCCMIGIAR